MAFILLVKLRGGITQVEPGFRRLRSFGDSGFPMPSAPRNILAVKGLLRPRALSSGIEKRQAVGRASLPPRFSAFFSSWMSRAGAPALRRSVSTAGVTLKSIPSCGRRSQSAGKDARLEHLDDLLLRQRRAILSTRCRQKACASGRARRQEILARPFQALSAESADAANAAINATWITCQAKRTAFRVCQVRPVRAEF